MLSKIFIAMLAVSSASAYICCVSKQFEVSEGGNIALKNGQLTSLYCRAAVDTDKNMTNANCILIQDEKKHNIRQIQDFNTQSTYVVFLDKGSCSKLPLKTKLDRCIPDGTKVTDMYFGKPKQSFSAPSFEVKYGKLPVYISVADVEDQDSCVPVSVTVTNVANILLESIGYFNYTEGIKDPSVFDIPSSCFKENQQMMPGFETMKQRFTLF